MKTKSKERICIDIPLSEVFGFGIHFSCCLDLCIPTTTSFPFIAWCNMLVLAWTFSRDYWPTSFKLLLLTYLCLLFFGIEFEWFIISRFSSRNTNKAHIISGFSSLSKVKFSLFLYLLSCNQSKYRTHLK